MAQLPPKVPTMTHPNWPPSFPPHQRMPPSTAAATISPSQLPPSWVDEFLDFTSARRVSHRRSMSDSIAFLEAPLVEECRNTLHGGGATGSNGGGGFDRLDDEQLMSMFSDDLAGGMPGMVGPPSSPSDQNSNNEDEYNAMSTEDNKNNDDDNHNGGKLQHEHVPKSEPGEVESACDTDKPGSAPPPSDNNATGLPSGGDPIVDPKRVKRILANRQSAQRSRVRKLQYISDLERSVTTLQTEVSALSPRVAFLDHQRLILNVDNSALKQRIAALAQDKIFKDAHQEALKKEIERLRQIYQQQQHQHQNLKKMQGNTNNTATASPPPSSDLNMGCTDTEPLMT